MKLKIVKLLEPDTYFEQYNLLDMENGTFLLNEWVNHIEKVQFGPRKTTLYLVSVYRSDGRVHEMNAYDESGYSLFHSGFSNIKPWCLNEYGNDRNLFDVTNRNGIHHIWEIVVNETGRIDLAKIVSARFYAIDPFLSITGTKSGKKSIRVIVHDEEGFTKYTFFSYPDLRPLTRFVFDDISFDRKRNSKYADKEDFVAVVKYCGRWRGLDYDGTFYPKQ